MLVAFLLLSVFILTFSVHPVNSHFSFKRLEKCVVLAAVTLAHLFDKHADEVACFLSVLLFLQFYVADGDGVHLYGLAGKAEHDAEHAIWTGDVETADANVRDNDSEPRL